MAMREKRSSPADEALIAAAGDRSREELLEWLGDAAKLWLAHDGLWFRAVEDHHGMAEAIRLDEEAMRGFTTIEARRIMDRLGLGPGGGLDALETALGSRLYALLNRQEIRREPGRLIFTMKSCRVQDARRRQGLAAFPCRSVGLLEYEHFARTVDPRLRLVCRHCPPDELPAGEWCSWEFSLEA